MKSLLVTGASGFLGSALIKSLLSSNFRIFGLSRRQGFLDPQTLAHPNFSFIPFDLGTASADDLAHALGTAAIEGIFHLASQQPSSAALTYRDYDQGNVQTTRTIIDYTRTHKIAFVAYTSTVSLLARKLDHTPLNEQTPVNPIDYYGLTKYTAEKLLEIALKPMKIPCIILRCPSIFGKEQPGGLVYTYYHLAKKGEPVEIYGNGQTRRNLLYISDAVQALENLIDIAGHLNPAQSHLFTLGSRDSLPMAHIARLIVEALASPSPIIPVSNPLPVPGHVIIDSAKAAEMLDFKPLTIAQGIELFLREMNHAH